jgi:hypothetical protein
MESLHSQYHHAHRLGQLIANAKGRQSFPHLAHRLSIWECEKDQDRLNALYGIVFCHDASEAWFRPSYSMSALDLYNVFAIDCITATRTIDILHFAGCADIECLELRLVNGIFVKSTDIAATFAITLTMGCRIIGPEQEDLAISVHELPTLFRHRAARNLSTAGIVDRSESTFGLEESTRFGNLAENFAATGRFSARKLVDWAWKRWCAARQLGLSDTRIRDSRYHRYWEWGAYCPRRLLHTRAHGCGVHSNR